MCASEKFLGLDSLGWSSIQALASIGGLLGLLFYCWETYNLRVAAQEQVEAVTKPIIAVSDEDFPKVVLKNIGNGPAFNVEYKFATSDNQATERLIPSLEVGVPYEMGELFFHLNFRAEIGS